MNVAVLGASVKPERYSNQAVSRLIAKDHTVFPVNPNLSEIYGTRVYPSLTQVPEPIDTVTVYLGPEKSSSLEKELLRVNPRRIIFNPGAENQELMVGLENSGIECIQGCTLALLSTGQF